jgi:hypothetical protein
VKSRAREWPGSSCRGTATLRRGADAAPAKKCLGASSMRPGLYKGPAQFLGALMSTTLRQVCCSRPKRCRTSRQSGYLAGWPDFLEIAASPISGSSDPGSVETRSRSIRCWCRRTPWPQQQETGIRDAGTNKRNWRAAVRNASCLTDCRSTSLHRDTTTRRDTCRRL